ncbi:unnamed protein product [Trichobilharzia regenti]|nr:unnamed protein product [Trichobilharzia regenti]
MADLEGLCRSGVPIQYREGVWRMLIHGELHQLMQIKGPLYYNGLLEEFSENTHSQCQLFNRSVNNVIGNPNINVVD